MILADTSVWVDHLRMGDDEFRNRLLRREIVTHPFVILELALGSLRDRNTTLTLLDQLPQVRMAEIPEVRYLIESRRLYALGIGVTDAHLIASALINPGVLLWTRDKPLRRIAEALGIDAALT